MYICNQKMTWTKICKMNFFYIFTKRHQRQCERHSLLITLFTLVQVSTRPSLLQYVCYILHCFYDFNVRHDYAKCCKYTWKRPSCYRHHHHHHPHHYIFIFISCILHLWFLCRIRYLRYIWDKTCWDPQTLHSIVES